MIRQQFILKKIFIEDVVSMYSVCMMWQVQKQLVVSWIGIALKSSVDTRTYALDTIKLCNKCEVVSS